MCGEKHWQTYIPPDVLIKNSNTLVYILTHASAMVQCKQTVFYLRRHASDWFMYQRPVYGVWEIQNRPKTLAQVCKLHAQLLCSLLLVDMNINEKQKFSEHYVSCVCWSPFDAEYLFLFLEGSGDVPVQLQILGKGSKFPYFIFCSSDYQPGWQYAKILLHFRLL